MGHQVRHVADYWHAGLLLPFDDVINAVGPEKFYEGANRVYEITPGIHAAAGIGNTAANMLWLRTDLMQKAGIDRAPENWDELRAACRKMQAFCIRSRHSKPRIRAFGSSSKEPPTRAMPRNWRPRSRVATCRTW